MPLPPGSLLGPYEILAPLGSGGMGEVYRARDSRLAREVALKILPEQFGADSDRRARFEREARAAAQLHHPSILAILDVGTQDSTPYIVTELLKGETLRERLRAGAIPSRKVIEIGSQVARGLGAAHAQGITHRDIKPENIFLCSDGQVKILDFGLARPALPDPTDSDSTLSLRTATGVVLGTASYLSPEQARGQSVDARSDIFSLGIVLYEMLACQRPFPGDTFADLISALLREDPAPLPASIKPFPALERIIHRCLEKSPAERFQSARDLSFQLDSLLSSSDSASGSNLPPVPPEPFGARALRSVPWLLAAIFALLSLGLLWQYRGRSASLYPNAHVQFQRLTDFVGMEESPAISPDGKSLAFVSDTTGSRQIWIRLLAGGPPLQLTHDPGDHLGPRWSADSASLYYFTRSADSASKVVVWQISALGGSPRLLLESVSEVDASHDGTSLAFFRLNGEKIELVRTGLNAENPRVLSSFPKASACRRPRWSPDDSAIAFLLAPGRWRDNIFSVSSAGGAAHQVTHDALFLAGFSWLPDSKGFVYSSPRLSTLLYLPTQHLWKISLDGNSLQQLTFGNDSDEAPDVDSRGRIAISRNHLSFDLWKFPLDSDPRENVRRAIQITRQTGSVQTPSLNPDGTQLAYLSDTGGHGNLWILDLKTLQSRQVTYEKDPQITLGVPVWSHDGANIAYVRLDGISGLDGIQFWTVHPDGSNNRYLLARGNGLAWSWDSKSVYFSEQPNFLSGGPGRILKVEFPSGQSTVVRSDSSGAPAPSPDGTTLYYCRTLEAVNGLWDYDIRKATPPDSAVTSSLTHISPTRVPLWQALHPTISNDGRWLALTLNDQLGTNIWLLSTTDGKMHPVTDFGDRRTFIARRVNWSPDNKWVYAAVGDGDSDVFLLDGLLH